MHQPFLALITPLVDSGGGGAPPVAGWGPGFPTNPIPIYPGGSPNPPGGGQPQPPNIPGWGPGFPTNPIPIYPGGSPNPPGGGQPPNIPGWGPGFPTNPRPRRHNRHRRASAEPGAHHS